MKILDAYGPDGDLAAVTELALDLERRGLREDAASAWDRAFGLAPDEEWIATRRANLLDGLSVELHGLRFRYIPAGSFLMGDAHGDPDEAPVHPVRVGPYWLAEVPTSWADFDRLMGWEDSFPAQDDDGDFRRDLFYLAEAHKIRRQYCENRAAGAADWHAHLDEEGIREIFGTPPRQKGVPAGYDRKPMVAVSWRDMAELGMRLSDDEWKVGLPTEAQWERAARGGLIGKRYPWGDGEPTPELADFDHFGEFVVHPCRRYPANGYGLYGMAGGVWEWCRDWYKTDSYRSHALVDPFGPQQGAQKVLRGGSWSDCADTLRCAFRMSLDVSDWRDDEWGAHVTPNVGGRLVLQRRAG